MINLALTAHICGQGAHMNPYENNVKARVVVSERVCAPATNHPHVLTTIALLPLTDKKGTTTVNLALNCRRSQIKRERRTYDRDKNKIIAVYERWLCLVATANWTQHLVLERNTERVGDDWCLFVCLL